MTRSKSRRNVRTLGAPQRRHASLSLNFCCRTVAASTSSDTTSVFARVGSVNTCGFTSVLVRLVLLSRPEAVKPVLSMPLPMTAAVAAQQHETRLFPGCGGLGKDRFKPKVQLTAFFFF